MTYHILTPFSRWENKEPILENFRHPNVIFHPLMEVTHYSEFPKEVWIQPFYYLRDPGTKKIWFNAVNQFLDQIGVVDDHYYLYLADDDFMEPGFLDKLKGIDTNFIFVSMKRGHHVTSSRYGTNTLVPRIGQLHESRIGWEQLLIKGKILKLERFGDTTVSDGEFIRRIWKKYPHDQFTFKIDAYVWFNYLEKGRWDK